MKCIAYAAALVIFSTVGVKAQFNLQTNADGKSVIVTGYTGPGGIVVIPNSIDGLIVTGIGEEAFMNTAVTSVTIPSTVTSMGTGAFVNLGGLTNATIEPGLTSIPDYSFAYTGLTSVAIPMTVTNLGMQAFYACKQLTNISIGCGVESIGDAAFQGCSFTRRYS